MTLTGKYVLSADDNPANHDILAAAAKRLGVTLASAHTGAEAVAAVEEGHYDLVFMDVSMPEMDGFEATRRIRALEAPRRQRPIPIIALTAHAFTPDIESWQDAGLSDLLVKPFTLRAIRDCLSKWLGSPCADHSADNAAAADASTPSPSSPHRRLHTLSDVDVLASIHAISPGDDGLLMRVANVYADRAPAHLSTLRDTNPTDTLAIAERAHALMSLSRNIGAERVDAIANEISESARRGIPLDEDTLERLASSLHASLDALASLVPQTIAGATRQAGAASAWRLAAPPSQKRA